MLNQARLLSIEEIEAVAKQFKEDLQRKVDRYVRQDESRDAYAAVLAKEYVEQFVNTLSMVAVSQIGRPVRARPINILKTKA